MNALIAPRARHHVRKSSFAGVGLSQRSELPRRGCSVRAAISSKKSVKRAAWTISAKAAATSSEADSVVMKTKTELAAERKRASIAARDNKRTEILGDKLALGRPVLWETMFRYMEGSVTGVTPQELEKLLEKKQVELLDIRSPDDGASDVAWMNPGFFIEGTMRKGVIEEATNIPLCTLIEGTSMYKQMRRFAFSYIFGVLNGQELRPTFVKEVTAQYPDKKTPFVVMCDSKYGTMETAIGRDFGIRCRALQAAYYLKKVGGYSNVRFLQGGFLGWQAAGLPVKAFKDADANPFAEGNMKRMSQILFFLIFVTSFKTGAIFLPFIFLSEPGTLCDSYDLCELEEIRSIYVNTFKNLLG